jgi:hypothetical protein
MHGVSLRPIACWDCGFEFLQGHGCQVQVCVLGRSPIERGSTDVRVCVRACVCMCVIVCGVRTSERGGPSPLWAVAIRKNKQKEGLESCG